MTPRYFALFIFVFLLAACSAQPPTTSVANPDLPSIPSEYAGKKNPLAGDAAAIEVGQETYNVYCSSCHGETGQGDGPAAASLDPKPKPLAITEAGLGDDYLYWRIAEGGLTAPFNSAMPAWKNLFNEEKIWQVIAYLRALPQ